MPAVRFRLKRNHLSRIQQALWVVAPLGEQLNVVRAIAPAAFHIIHVRIGHKHADFAAEINDVVQPFLGREINQGNRARNHAPVAVFHEFHVKENFVAESFLQQPQLLAHLSRIETRIADRYTLRRLFIAHSVV